MRDSSSPPFAIRSHSAIKRYLYAWGDGQADGDGSMRDLLGGKGAGLAEMTKAGLAVPPGFTITTEACNDYFADGGRSAVRLARRRHGRDRGSRAQDRQALRLSRVPVARERALGREALDARNDGHRAEPGPERRRRSRGSSRSRTTSASAGTPIGGSCRCSAGSCSACRASASITRSRPRRHRAGARADVGLSAAALRELVGEYRSIVREETGARVSERSARSARARDRGRVQELVRPARARVPQVPQDRRRPRHRRERGRDGVRQHGEDSGTGVAFTRDPNTGANATYGEYLTNAQGEDVVAGIRTAPKIAEMAARNAATCTRSSSASPTARTPLPRRAGPRVHDRARPALHAADALGEAHRRGRGEDRGRHGATKA